MIGDVRVDEGRQTARELGAAGSRVAFIELDVTDEAQWQEKPAPPAPSAFGEAFRKAAEDAAQ